MVDLIGLTPQVAFLSATGTRPPRNDKAVRSLFVLRLVFLPVKVQLQLRVLLGIFLFAAVREVFQIALSDHILDLISQLHTVLSVVSRRLMELTSSVFIFVLVPQWKWPRFFPLLFVLHYAIDFSTRKSERSV